MLPSVAFGLAPNVMAQAPVPVDESVHRPARLRGGTTAAELAGAALAGGLLEELPSSEKRSLPPLQAASSAVQTRIETVATRDAMKCEYGPEGAIILLTRMLPPCQGATRGGLYKAINAD